ncbi:MAG TPA: hypothetical protein DCG49_00490 [Ruminococcus sp.]|nr:hypothetical protein [Ruminococcus sp.]
MKHYFPALLLLAACLLTGCGSTTESNSVADSDISSVSDTVISDETTQPAESETEPAETEPALAVASGDDVIAADAVGYEGMEAVTADALQDGVYSISVDSSSSMFRITDCLLTVENGKMTAKMTMSGAGYEALYSGTAADAAAAPESERIPFTEENDVHCFTFPVAALDQEIDCAAFSTKKQLWYDRKLVFRADSLPDHAFKEREMVTAETLELADGEYTIAVTLEGGSGKASVQSPAKLTVSGGEATAELIWSSNKYDYMRVNDVQYLPTDTTEFSVFEIPVTEFDRKLNVTADTTAMSTPHEIEYTLYFDSSSIE